MISPASSRATASRDGQMPISGPSILPIPRNRAPWFHAIAMPMLCRMLSPSGHADPGSYPEWVHRSRSRPGLTIWQTIMEPKGGKRR